MKQVLFFVIAFTIASSIVPVHNGFAAIFKYVDKNGTACFCDNLYSIPERYRKGAVIVKSDAERVDKPSPDQKSEASVSARGTDKRETYISTEAVKDAVRNVHGGKLFHPFAAFTGALAAFIVIGKLAKSLNRKRVGSLLRFVVAAGVIFYIFYAYTQEIASTYALVRGELFGAQNLTEETNRRAGDAVKGLSEKPAQLQ